MGYQKIHKLITVNFAYQTACVVVIGNIGRVLSQDISGYLVDRVISFFKQGIIHRLEYVFDFALPIFLYGKGSGFVIFKSHGLFPFSDYPPGLPFD